MRHIVFAMLAPLLLYVPPTTTAPVIDGSAQFQQNTEAALQLLVWFDNDTYQVIRRCVDEIVEVDGGPGVPLWDQRDRNGCDGQGTIRITEVISQYEAWQYAAILSHEVEHIRLIDECVPFGGVDGEATAIRRQIVTAKRLGAPPEYITYLEWHIGKHGLPSPDYTKLPAWAPNWVQIPCP